MAQIHKAAKDGDDYCQLMCEDIQKNGQPANRPQGGVYHRMAGTHAGDIKARKEFWGKINAKKEVGSAAAKVIDSKTKNATYKGWNLTEK